MAVTSVAIPAEIVTGTSTNASMAIQPSLNRRPRAIPKTVSTNADATVRAASATSRPATGLARWTGCTHNLVSTPDSRSDGKAKPAPMVPKTAPTTAHIGTNPYRLSCPVTASTDLPTSSL